MRIRGAIGLGLTIIVLKFLMGEVFSAFEDVLLTVLSVSDRVLGAVATALPQ